MINKEQEHLHILHILRYTKAIVIAAFCFMRLERIFIFLKLFSFVLHIYFRFYCVTVAGVVLMLTVHILLKLLINFLLHFLHSTFGKIFQGDIMKKLSRYVLGMYVKLINNSTAVLKKVYVVKSVAPAP